jgi:hypothetical protein
MGDEKSEPGSTIKNMRTPLPSREFVTRAQLDNLLAVIGSAANVWLAATHPEREGANPTGGKHDGGIAYAAEETVIKALDRLNALLTDNARWDMKLQDTLEALLARMYSENTEVLKQTSYATALACAPHTRFRPVLVKIGDEWIAAYGDTDKPESLICGRGPTPHLAMLSFDAAFLNGTPEVEVVDAEVIKPEEKLKQRKRKS